MILGDWRDASPALVRACYDAERRYWQSVLAWETAPTWDAVEQARVGWGLPGAILTNDRGEPEGWCFYLPEENLVSIGGLTAASPAATAMLLDAILEAARHQGAAAVSCFLPDRAAGFGEMLAERGFALEPHLYLVAPLVAPLIATAGRRSLAATAAVECTEAWSTGDVAAAAELLRHAYPGDSGLQFAPHGAWPEWLRYVTNLVEQTGCGALEPDLTRVVHAGTQLHALALVTNLGLGTAHLAQLAVHQQRRRQGLAEQLLREAMVRAAESGLERMTLLVAERNQAARGLYAALGFEPRAGFLAARLVLAASPAAAVVSPSD